MRELNATVLSHEFAWASFRILRLHVPAVGRIAPGLFLLLRALGGIDPLLARPVFLSREDVRMGAIEIITEDAQDRRRLWMSMRTDDPIWLLGTCGTALQRGWPYAPSGTHGGGLAARSAAPSHTRPPATGA